MNYTNIEQSEHLLSLGLDANTADMSWRFDIENQAYCRDIAAYTDYSTPLGYVDNSVNPVLPCWSIGALLEVMPEGTELNKITCEGAYQCCNLYHYSIVGTVINVCYEMTCWLLENGYINKNK